MSMMVTKYTDSLKRPTAQMGKKEVKTQPLSVDDTNDGDDDSPRRCDEREPNCEFTTLSPPLFNLIELKNTFHYKNDGELSNVFLEWFRCCPFQNSSHSHFSLFYNISGQNESAFRVCRFKSIPRTWPIASESVECVRSR